MLLTGFELVILLSLLRPAVLLSKTEMNSKYRLLEAIISGIYMFYDLCHSSNTAGTVMVKKGNNSFH